MSRKIVPLITDEIYHVYNRGTDRREIFLNKNDYLRFYQTFNVFNVVTPIINFDSALVLHKKGTQSEKLVEILAYALLPNHYHLILKQLVDGGISEFIKRIAGGYTSYFNLEQKRSGVLFQGKFKRVHVDTDEQLNYLIVYVNENHFVHGYDFEREICHSSSIHYQGIRKSILINSQFEEYNFGKSVELARQIYEQRKLLKRDTTFE